MTGVGGLRAHVSPSQITDIIPRQGRAILFLSDQLEHQVLALDNIIGKEAITRRAMTIWFNQHVKPKVVTNTPVL